MGLAFVDLDGTLLRGPSCEQAFIGRLLRRGALGPRQALASTAFVLRWGARFGRHVLRTNKAWLSGFEVSEIARLAADFDLAPRLRPVMLTELARVRAAGTRLVLLTGAPDFLAEPIGRAVGAELTCATLCARNGARYAAAPPLRHPFGAAKLALARRIAGERGMPLSACAAYGDSIYDLPLLAAVGRPVPVAPDRLLRAAAKAKGWRVLDDSSAQTAAWRARAGARA
jgi:HAD superfamily phosphoserine phosphatase-like hydrolase